MIPTDPRVVLLHIVFADAQDIHPPSVTTGPYPSRPGKVVTGHPPTWVAGTTWPRQLLDAITSQP